MADTTNDIKEYNRATWTLADLREIVTDTDAWDAAATVLLTAPAPKSARGTIEVQRAG